MVGVGVEVKVDEGVTEIDGVCVLVTLGVGVGPTQYKPHWPNKIGRLKNTPPNCTG